MSDDIEGFASNIALASQAGSLKVDLLALFLKEGRAQDTFQPREILLLFQTLGIRPYGRVNSYLSEETRKRNGKYMRYASGYRIERQYYEHLRDTYLPLTPVSKQPKQASITLETLHPLVKSASSALFNDGHYGSAVLESYKTVVNEVKRVSGRSDIDGKTLMETAFSINSPIIKLNSLTTQSERDEQVGFMYLLSGSVLGVRNPKAHELSDLKDPYRTLEYLSFASLLLSRIDERIEPSL